jgi:hypothetical protein
MQTSTHCFRSLGLKGRYSFAAQDPVAPVTSPSEDGEQEATSGSSRQAETIRIVASRDPSLSSVTRIALRRQYAPSYKRRHV